MTYRKSGCVFRVSGALLSGVAAIGLALAAGCATATIEDAVPVAATQNAGSSNSALSEMAGNPMQPADADLPTTVSVTPSSSTGSGEVAEAGPASALAPGEVQGSSRNTGIYPNLNIKPGVANEQIAPKEKKSKLAELEGKRRAQAAEAAANRPAIDQARLKKLAATNAKEVLKEIEGE